MKYIKFFILIFFFSVIFYAFDNKNSNISELELNKLNLNKINERIEKLENELEILNKEKTTIEKRNDVIIDYILREDKIATLKFKKIINSIK